MFESEATYSDLLLDAGMSVEQLLKGMDGKAPIFSRFHAASDYHTSPPPDHAKLMLICVHSDE